MANAIVGIDLADREQMVVCDHGLEGVGAADVPVQGLGPGWRVVVQFAPAAVVATGGGYPATAHSKLAPQAFLSQAPSRDHRVQPLGQRQVTRGSPREQTDGACRRSAPNSHLRAAALFPQ